jgi:hydrogenase maturation protease
VKTLILGIGNLLLCDEGVGVHVARALQRETLPMEVTTLEIGTGFLDAISAIEQADRILIVDAMKGDEEPGTVYRVPFEDCARPECIASLHGFDLSRVIFLAGKDITPEVVVFGVEPARIDWDTELSPQVQRAVPFIVQAVKAELAI